MEVDHFTVSEYCFVLEWMVCILKTYLREAKFFLNCTSNRFFKTFPFKKLVFDGFRIFPGPLHTN